MFVYSFGKNMGQLSGSSSIMLYSTYFYIRKFIFMLRNYRNNDIYRSSSIKQAYQNILISGSAGDVHASGCWAKGDSVPLTSGTSRRFGIVLRF